MDTLIIEQGIKTPGIMFIKSEGRLEIRGKSIPENSLEFYEPVFSWLDDYANDPKLETQLVIALEYFNTSSSKCLLDVMRKLESLHLASKSKVSILWLYEEDDEDMLEAGEDYKTIVKLPFETRKS